MCRTVLGGAQWPGSRRVQCWSGPHRFLSSLPSSVEAGRIIALYGPSTSNSIDISRVVSHSPAVRAGVGKGWNTEETQAERRSRGAHGRTHHATLTLVLRVGAIPGCGSSGRGRTRGVILGLVLRVVVHLVDVDVEHDARVRDAGRRLGWVGCGGDDGLREAGREHAPDAVRVELERLADLLDQRAGLGEREGWIKRRAGRAAGGEARGRAGTGGSCATWDLGEGVFTRGAGPGREHPRCVQQRTAVPA